MLLSLGLNNTIEFYYFRILHHLGININKGNIVESGIKHQKSTLNRNSFLVKKKKKKKKSLKL